MTQILLKLVFCTAQASGVSPYIVASVIQVESSWRTDAVGGVGEQGLAQLRPEFFDHVDLLDPEENIRLAVLHMADIKTRCSSLNERAGWKRAWVICHNTGVTGAHRLKEPENFGYLQRVRKAYNEYKAKRLFEDKDYSCD